MEQGERMHIDAHLTLPWYYQVKDAEVAIHGVEDLIAQHFDNKIEIFIHIDACQPYSCKLCAKQDCNVRRHPIEGQVEWNKDNVWYDAKHGKEANN